MGAVGAFMAVAIDLLIVLGKNSFDSTKVGSTMGLVAFSLMLAVAAFECRDAKASVLRQETFDNRTVNLTALVEVVLAILIAKGVFLPSLLGTDDLSGGKWLLAAVPAVVLLLGWELAKVLARRHSTVHRPAPTGVRPVSAEA